MSDIVEQIESAQEWMRKPDWAETFSFGDIVDWINDRPTHILPAAAAEIIQLREIIAEKDRALEPFMS